MIAVTVHLHTILQQTPRGTLTHQEINLPEGSQIADLLRILDIRLDAGALILVINHRVVDLAAVLREGDQIDLIPAISGG